MLHQLGLQVESGMIGSDGDSVGQKETPKLERSTWCRGEAALLPLQIADQTNWATALWQRAH
jgi:hypothetical protein